MESGDCLRGCERDLIPSFPVRDLRACRLGISLVCFCLFSMLEALEKVPLSAWRFVFSRTLTRDLRFKCGLALIAPHGATAAFSAQAPCKKLSRKYVKVRLYGSAGQSKKEIGRDAASGV